MFNQKEYPNLYKLDEKVARLLERKEVRDWSKGRLDYEISKIHPVWWMEHFGKILSGNIELTSGGETSGLIPFKLNKSQLKLADKICSAFVGDVFKRVMLIILKHRKVGVSTLIAGFVYWLMRFYGLRAFVIADVGAHTDNIMEMLFTFYSNDVCGLDSELEYQRPLQKLPMPYYKKGMRLSNGAMVEQDSGENTNPGTSGTVQVLHCSEVSKWRDIEKAETSLFNSVPRRGFAFLIKESTAFGMNKFAKDCIDAFEGRSAWDFYFCSWLDMEDCCIPVMKEEEVDFINSLSDEERSLLEKYKDMTLGHIKFRRYQISLLGSKNAFIQDFPLYPMEPFYLKEELFFPTDKVNERLMEIRFFREWKSKGIETALSNYPDMKYKLNSFPRGVREGLYVLENRNVIPEKVVLRRDFDTVVADKVKEECVDTVTIFRYPLVNSSYVVTIDVSEGKKDYSVCEVFDMYRCEQVAEWCFCVDEEITADIAVKLGMFYNNALLVPEMNNKCGGVLLYKLEEKGYKYIYSRDVGGERGYKKEYGWRTTAGNKAMICAEMRSMFREGILLLHSDLLLEEMLHFELGINKKSFTDDRVMATAIASVILRSRRIREVNKESNKQVMLRSDLVLDSNQIFDVESDVLKRYK